MLERRSGTDRRLRGRPFVSEAEQALESIAFLRPEIVAYVREFGSASAAQFERVIAVWYRGSLEQRAAFVTACAGDPVLGRAWKIVHAAGALAAPLIPYAVRRYYGQPTIDERA